MKKKHATKLSPHCTDFGGEGKTIILLHGFLASSKYWAALRPLLIRAGYRVVVIDLFGFGGAPKPNDASYNYDDHIDHIHTTIRLLSIDQPFILIGHSMGALIAARYSNVYPGEAQATVLLHPPLYKDTSEAQTTLRKKNIVYRFLLDSRHRRFAWALIKLCGGSFVGNHSQTSREKSLQNIIETPRIFEDLRDVDTKTLLIVGLRDRGEYIINLGSLRPNRLVSVKIENVNHHSPILRPSRIRNCIAEFV